MQPTDDNIIGQDTEDDLNPEMGGTLMPEIGATRIIESVSGGVEKAPTIPKIDIRAEQQATDISINAARGELRAIAPMSGDLHPEETEKMMDSNLRIMEEERKARESNNIIAQAGKFIGGAVGGFFARLRK